MASMTASDALFAPDDYFRVHELHELFADHEKPFEVDLGCGDGEFLQGMAAHHPERNFLGVERLIGRIDKTRKRITEHKLTNARVLRLESTYTIAWLLPEHCVSRVHLLCPDPWPKKKHEQRRLVNDESFLKALERALVPGGEFLLKTDDAPYFQSALESFAKRDAFEQLDWPEDAFYYPKTGFETDWLALGKTIRRARWRLRQLVA